MKYMVYVSRGEGPMVNSDLPAGGTGRLADRVAVVVGAGQIPGASVGNGRAAALLYARAGARVVAVDRDADAARETSVLIEREGGEAVSIAADVTREDEIVAALAAATDRWGRLDILHNNVGVSVLGGDAPVTETDAAVFSRLLDINLRGMVLACKHALPVMREQRSGVVINIASNPTTPRRSGSGASPNATA